MILRPGGPRCPRLCAKRQQQNEDSLELLRHRFDTLIWNYERTVKNTVTDLRKKQESTIKDLHVAQNYLQKQQLALKIQVEGNSSANSKKTLRNTVTTVLAVILGETVGELLLLCIELTRQQYNKRPIPEKTEKGSDSETKRACSRRTRN